MVVFMSNCKQSFVKRIEVLDTMAQHFPVLKFGACFKLETSLAPAVRHCLSLQRRSAMWDSPKECTLQHVMFSFALENSIESGYVTEKLWQPLKMGAIPIYSIGNISDNRLFLPHPDSALIIEDFASLKHLAEYMHEIVKTPKLWFKHAMAWRRLPVHEISEKFLWAIDNSYVTLPCRLCEWWIAHTHPRKNNSHTNVLQDITSDRMNHSDNLQELRACVLDEFGRLWNRQALLRDHTEPNHSDITASHFGFDVFFCCTLFDVAASEVFDGKTYQRDLLF